MRLFGRPRVLVAFKEAQCGWSLESAAARWRAADILPAGVDAQTKASTQTKTADAQGQRPSRRRRAPASRARPPLGRGPRAPRPQRLQREAMTPRYKRDLLGQPDSGRPRRGRRHLRPEPQDRALGTERARPALDRQPDQDHDGGDVHRRRAGPRPEVGRHARRPQERVGHLPEDRRARHATATCCT